MAVARVKSVRNILMELRKVCQHPYLSEPELEVRDLPQEKMHKNLVNASGKLQFLKVLLPKLIAKGHRVLLFSQFKMSLDQIQDFLYGENILALRLDGDTPQSVRQKNMDLFNAPNSPYSVFLLTTRAGGVGINLATADTIILHDPDFNPHQDLQAIARAHRYGQTKKVLVFKLMIKGSVEETIIEKGKRKMVLDHLVVQQLGKEPDDNDYEDLFLKNVAGMYGNGGINIPDINYTSARVDELIEKVEADAEVEALAMAERHRKIDNGEIEAGVSQGGAQFGFAKIWEADEDLMRAEATAETQRVNEEDVEDDMDWESLMAAIEKERADRTAKELEEGRMRRKQKAQEGIYRIFEEEDTPQKPKKARPSKGKDGGESDGDWVNNNDLSDAEKDSPLAGYDPLPDDDVRDMLSGNMDALVGPVPHHSPKHPKKGQSKKPSSSRSTPSIPRPQDHPLSGSLPSNPNHDPMVDLWKGTIHSGRRWSGSATKTSKSESSPSVAPPTKKSISSKPPKEIVEAQNIVQWMYHILRELNDFSLVDRWTLISLPEIAYHERMRAYFTVAKDIDARLVGFGEEKWFSNEEQIRAVERLLGSGFDVIPEVTRGPLAYPGGKAGLKRADDMPGSSVMRLGLPTLHDTAAPPLQSSCSAQSSSRFHQTSSAGPSNNPLNRICERCNSTEHDLRDCPELYSLDTLEHAIKAFHAVDLDDKQKASGMKSLEKMRQMLVKAAKIDPNHHIPGLSPAKPSTPTLHKANGDAVESPSHASSGPMPPIKDTGIMLEHDEKTELEKVGAAVPERLVTGQLRQEVYVTPQKRKGKERETAPDSLERPPKRSTPKPPDPPAGPQICPFCEKPCLNPLRTCVQKNGSRKALKNKIRVLDEKIRTLREVILKPKEDELATVFDKKAEMDMLKQLQLPLFLCYKEWPR
ncbi:hypothetical protein IAR50_002853 [Cryptococcus sp. DSM 104548]